MNEEWPRVPTPLSSDATARQLVKAYEQLFGRRPTRPLAELLLAQIWVENSRGASIIQHNWGNLTPGSTWKGPIWRPPWYDPPPDASPRILRLHGLMLEGKEPSAFRAYPDHDAGAAAYLRVVHGERYRPLLAAGERGDVVAFAEAIRDTGYCPRCEPRSTAHTLAQLRDDIRASGAFAELGGAGAGGDDVTLPLVLLGVRLLADRW